ncbi:uncharacterized protein LOC112562320 isoform X2 [Pomacea canaliculata]|uniref:uncharacterized protein LOC112562320 isoform X2 n=1 Tax=Pomacea canaliculata TaxID=400727 RepID=UPI000D72B335|nr:uncharacterized protein LOC112562320 isoform X2 [Pomacea canaliculata]
MMCQPDVTLCGVPTDPPVAVLLYESFPISRTVAVLSQAMAEAELEDYTRSLMTDVPKEVEDWVFNSPCIKIRKTTTARIQASSSLNHTSPLLMQPAPQQHSPSSLPAMQMQRPVLFLSLPQPTLMQVQRSQPSPSALP